MRVALEWSAHSAIRCAQKAHRQDAHLQAEETQSSSFIYEDSLRATSPEPHQIREDYNVTSDELDTFRRDVPAPRGYRWIIVLTAIRSEGESAGVMDGA